MANDGVRPGINRIREARDLATTLGPGVNGYSLIYQHSTGDFVLSDVSGGGGGTSDHALLSNLAYADSGHTGFAGTGVANTFTQNQQFNQNITITGDVIVGDDISVTDDVVVGGDVTAASIITPLITSGSNVDVTLNPGGTGAVVLDDSTVFRSATFDSSFPIGGFKLGPTAISGQFGLTVGEIQADTIRTVTFVANETRVERANQYWTKSYGITVGAFTTPGSIGGTVGVKFEDAASITGAIASDNDWVLFRTVDISTGLTIQQSWGQLSGYTNNGDGTQTWVFTLRSGDAGVTYIDGSLSTIFGASGAAYIHLSVNDIAGAPYIKGRRWVTNPYTTGNHTTYWQLGTLGGTANPNYTPTGNGLYARSGASANQFIVIDDNGMQIRNTDLKMFNGSTQTVDINSANGSLMLGSDVTSGTTTGFSFDGATGNIVIGGASYAPTVTIYGVVNIKAGSVGIANLTDKGALATVNDLDGVPNGSTYNKTTVDQVTGAGRAYSALDGSNRLVTAVIPGTAVTPSGAGLYLSSTHLGYYNGSVWKTYIDSSGNFLFAGSSGSNYLQWAASSNKLQGVGGGVEQWYASASDGVLYAGAGNVWLDASGLNFQVQTFGSPDYIRFERSSTALATIGFQRATGGGPLTTDGMIFNNIDGTKFRFIGASVLEVGAVGNDIAVNITGAISTSQSGGFQSLTVGRGALSATAVLQGTTHASHFNDGTTEHTYIRGGKAGSHVYLNDGNGMGQVWVSGRSDTTPAELRLNKLDSGSTNRLTSKVTFYANDTTQVAAIIADPDGNTNFHLAFQTGTTERLRINSGGEVGIGGAPTTATLAVYRGSGADGSLVVRGTTYNCHFNNSTAEDTYLRGGKAASNVWIADVNSGNVNVVYGGGNVNVGATPATFTWKFNVIKGNGQMSFNPDFSGTNYLSSYVSGAAGPLALFGSEVLVDGDTFRISTAKTPTGTSTGTPGMIARDANFLYVCTATNVWRRVALSAF